MLKKEELYLISGGSKFEARFPVISYLIRVIRINYLVHKLFVD